jgi:hypothetical protein
MDWGSRLRLYEWNHLRQQLPPQQSPICENVAFHGANPQSPRNPNLGHCPMVPHRSTRWALNLPLAKRCRQLGHRSTTLGRPL